MGYSVVNIADVRGAGRGGAEPDALTMIAVGARRGSYEPRGPF